MPHGIIAQFQDFQGLWYATTNTGYPDNYGTQVWKYGCTYKPASTNNPKVLGIRGPAAWYCRRDRWEVSDGLVVCRNRQDPSYFISQQGKLSDFQVSDASQLATFDPSLAQDVLRNTLSRLTEENVQLNAFLAQGRSTLKLVDNLARGLAGGLDVFMTNEFRKVAHWKRFLATAADDAISNFSSKYLEYLYGWKPLTDDVTNAFQFLHDGYVGPEKKQFRVVCRGFAGTKEEVGVTRDAAMYYMANWAWTQTLYRRRKTKLTLQYTFPSQSGEMIPTLTPFGTAWELAPWSFVIDWFIPIGAWVGAMEATQYAIYMDHAVLTQSVQVASRGSGSRWTKSHANAASWYIDRQAPIPRLSGSSFYMTREVLDPIQVLDRIKFPDLRSRLGLSQASQALALLQQVLHKWS